MTPAEKKYQDIIHMDRPVNADLLRKYPRMSLQERAKIFSPFAALRGQDEKMEAENQKLLRQKKIERFDEDSAALSGKLLQIKKGMEITVRYFEPDSSDCSEGYYKNLTGKVTAVDYTFQILKIIPSSKRIRDTGSKIIDTVIHFKDILDVKGDGIITAVPYNMTDSIT